MTDLPHPENWSHTKKRGWGNTNGHVTMDSSGKQEERKAKEQLEKIGYQRSG
jgi:hypothetical protein